MLSKVGREIRKQRLLLCNNECELAIHGRDHCDNFRLECHHKDDFSYEKDKLGTIEITDVIIVCSFCHDFLTDARRLKRFGEQKLICSIIEEKENEVR